MALKQAFNWDHLAGVNLIPSPTAGNSLPYSLTQWLELGTPSSTAYAYVSNTTNTIQIDSNGWLTFGQTSASGSMSAILLPLANVIDTTKPASWLGFRFKPGGTQLQNSAAVNLIWTGSGNGSGAGPIITMANVVSWGCVLGKEYYFELQFVKGASNYTVNVWVDGILKASNISSVAVSGVASTYLWMGPANTNTGTTASTISFRDIYFLDEDGLGNWDSARVGPIRTTPLPQSSVSAPNYSAATAALTGNAALSSAQVKFGASSLATSTSGDGATIQDSPALKLTGDFTIEWFSYLTNASATIFLKGTTSSASRITTSSGVLNVYSDQSGSTVLLASSAGKVILNQWQHCALVKQGNVWTIYIDGQAVGTTTSAGQTFGNNVYPAYLANTANGSIPLIGYMDEFRISNVARYTGNFTPPSAAFTPDANTVMLMHFDQAPAGFLRDEVPTPQAVLSTPHYGGSATITPNLTNAATLDPLTVSFDSSAIPPGSKILGVKYQNAVMNQQSGNGVVNAAAVMGSSNVSLPQETFTDATMRYTRQIGFLRNAPDGSAWTAAKIAATQLVLTPTSV